MKGAPTVRDKHWFGPCNDSMSGMMFHFREKETEAREIFCWCFPLPHSSCCTPFHLRWLSSLPWGHHYYLGLILSLHSSPYLGMFPLSLFQILRLPGISWLQSSLTPPKQNGCYWFILTPSGVPLWLLFSLPSRCIAALLLRRGVGNSQQWEVPLPDGGLRRPHWVKVWAPHISLVFHHWTHAVLFSLSSSPPSLKLCLRSASL